MAIDNLFHLPPPPWPEEVLETLHQARGTRIERILSCGHTTPIGEFYDQEDDEWVVLLQGEAELTYEDGSTRRLAAGDYLFIPAHQRHRVSYTSSEPPCLWLAVHMGVMPV
jgi:cupin 2 domain-containing protein